MNPGQQIGPLQQDGRDRLQRAFAFTSGTEGLEKDTRDI